MNRRRQGFLDEELRPRLNPRALFIRHPPPVVPARGLAPVRSAPTAMPTVQNNNANLRRAIQMSLQRPGNNRGGSGVVNNNANLRRAIQMSLQRPGNNRGGPSGVNNTLTNNTLNNVMMTERIKNLNRYVLFLSKTANGRPHYFRAPYNNALTYIRTSQPEMRNITWSQLIQMRTNTPNKIVAPHPSRSGQGLIVGTMRFFGPPPANAVRNTRPAPGTWVNFNNGHKVRPPTMDETDAFNHNVKLKNLPYFVETTSSNGRKTRFAHTNAKFETSFPERWIEILEAHGKDPASRFDPINIPALRRIVPNIEIYYNTNLGQVKFSQIKLIGKKSEYIKYLSKNMGLRNIGIAETKNNLARMIPKLSDNIPEYKLIKAMWKSGNKRNVSWANGLKLSDYALVLLKLIRIEPAATEYITAHPEMTNANYQAEIARTVMACHLIQTLNNTSNRTAARLNYLKNIRGQLKIAGNLFVEERSRATNKSQFDAKFIKTLVNNLGGNPCLENLIDGIVMAIVEPGLEWRGRNRPPLNVNATGSITAASRNRLRNIVLGTFMSNYYKSLPNSQKGRFNANSWWTGIRKRNLLVKRANQPTPTYIKLEELPDGRRISNEAWNTFSENLTL